MPSRMRCSVPAEIPRRPRSLPASAAWRRSSSVSTPRPCHTALDGLRPDTGHREQLDEAGRHLGTQSVVERHAARRRELDDLVADRAADPRDRPSVAGGVRGRHVEGRTRDRVGGPVVGLHLEDELAPDLEHVADLVEDRARSPLVVRPGWYGRRGRVEGRPRRRARRRRRTAAAPIGRDRGREPTRRPPGRARPRFAR